MLPFLNSRVLNSYVSFCLRHAEPHTDPTEGRSVPKFPSRRPLGGMENGENGCKMMQNVSKRLGYLWAYGYLWILMDTWLLRTVPMILYAYI